eukprot:1083181-Pelagomonas_calceolata.AAC.4
MRRRFMHLDILANDGCSSEFGSAGVSAVTGVHVLQRVGWRKKVIGLLQVHEHEMQKEFDPLSRTAGMLGLDLLPCSTSWHNVLAL